MWDFLCLQEVDRHQELFVEDKVPGITVIPTSSLQEKRNCYLGQTFMKSDGVMGCAIYYNAQKFECLDIESSPFMDAKGKEMN